MSKKPEMTTYLNRYTSLPFLLDILENTRLTLVDPKGWDDKNDIYYIELYKQYSEYKSVLALCFSGWNHRDTEKYHAWKTYSGNTSGVCIQFESAKLISYLEPCRPTMTWSMVEYMTVNELEKEWKGKLLEDLPFIKRVAYSGDHEFRIIYRTKEEGKRIFPLKINLDCISRIILNPWIFEDVDKSIVKFLNKIAEYKDIKIDNTTLREHKKWTRYGRKIAQENKKL